jgi:(2Fe-2S) ferredoxin
MERPNEIRTCYVCVHVWCAEGGSLAFKRELQEQLAEDGVEVREFLCVGCCPKAPNIVLYPEGTWYAQVQPEDLPAIVAHVKGAEPESQLTGRADPKVRALILRMLDRYVERGAALGRGD